MLSPSILSFLPWRSLMIATLNLSDSTINVPIFQRPISLDQYGGTMDSRVTGTVG